MTFEARFPGRCGGCGNLIHPGDGVEYVDDTLVHGGCAPQPDVDRPARPVCPDCFTEIALNGACSCP